MSALLSLFTGASGGWIACLVLALAVFGAGSYAGERVRGLIDTPKIVAAQAATKSAEADLEVETQNLAQANANIAALQGSLAADNADVARWQAAAQSASQRAAAASSAANKTVAAGQARVAALLNVQTSVNACVAALSLIHSAILP